MSSRRVVGLLGVVTALALVAGPAMAQREKDAFVPEAQKTKQPV